MAVDVWDHHHDFDLEQRVGMEQPAHPLAGAEAAERLTREQAVGLWTTGGLYLEIP